LNNTAATFGKPVVVVETGFPSRGAQFEPQFEFPVSTTGQRQFLEAVVDAVQQVPNELGWGAF
jgi:exo-beta-1,3-glucanase (GH17 family)